MLSGLVNGTRPGVYDIRIAKGTRSVVSRRPKFLMTSSLDEKHVILVGRENNLWISTDGAASFQHVAVRLNRTPSLSSSHTKLFCTKAPGRMKDFTFHPTRPDWVLAIKNGCDEVMSPTCSNDLYISTVSSALHISPWSKFHSSSFKIGYGCQLETDAHLCLGL